MASSSILPINNADLSFSRPVSFSSSYSPLLFEQRDTRLVTRRMRGKAFRVLANPNVSPGKSDFKKEVIMVDPLEAKRLAAKQMEKIKTKERMKRIREIESINGAAAMIGLTIGLIIEGRTGLGIPSQLAGYWEAIIHFFLR
ncbi:uncharacterized protein LOC124915018 isoform X2 [Impatiens glandulifera]|uniref:uncharacterized protein LOC124915018 isoform X2 n=1 Tax=Impatiens glandulifera TaxID=253017 RepID=UPI001FB128F5|nr:uncharacterized protein LOC124915018 isoform X2 [Impatiens glandulifera]